MSKPHLIGLTGYAGTGKDTVRALLDEHGYHVLAFADPIRMMVRELFTSAGIDTDYMDTRNLKEAIIPELGLSYRHMAQTLGTEWGRSLHPNFWTRIAGAYMIDCSKEPSYFHSFCISDVRFINEAQWVRDQGGVIWRVERPQAVPVRAHASEAEMYHFTADKTIVNDGSIDDLRIAVATLLGALK